jgi:flagellar motility protein MotE (MotC chaperone)
MSPALSARRPRRLLGCIAAVLLLGPAAFAVEDSSGGPDSSQAESDAATFCANIGDVASDARIAWEARTLDALRADVETKIETLDARRAELEEWVERREAFRKQAEDSIVDIYARMRPDAAAEQLALLDSSTAAAVLIRLKARVAGAILSEMDAPRAVALATMISTNGEAEDAGAVQQ